MKKILGFICAALTATIGFAEATGTTETDGTNTDGATGTETQAETTETITAIGVNFCSTKGADTTKALFVSAWTNNTAYGSSSVSGTIGLFDGSTTLSFSCKNTWTHTKEGETGTDSESSSFLNGYLDDGTNNQHTSGIEISCTNIPFDFYDVVIYYASDGDTSQFTAPTVNGARWTADTSCPSVAKKGSDNWGSSAFNNGACTYGANVLRLVGLSGDLSIASSGDYSTGYRGSIAAIQIVKSNHGVFGFDFNSRAKQSTNGTATFAASTVGELVPCANWVHCFDAPNSSTNFVSKTSSVSATWSCNNVYSTAAGRDSATDATFIHGYLDDGGSGITITCTNIPFAKYDVVIYMATDASNKKFTAPTVNEKQYTYDSANPAKAKDGSDAFGDSNVHDYCAYGTNVLRVRDLEGNLTIKSTAGTDARGCIAAIQILASPETMTVGGTEATAKNWSETSIWQDNTAATNDLVEVDLQGDATVTLDTDLNLDQLTVRNAHKLTLKNADPAKAVSIDFIGLKDGATLAIADEALTNVINNAAFYSALINDYKTPSTLISRTYGNVYTQGAGESGSSKTINAQGGSITLSGEGKTYYVNGGVSGTKTTVVFDGATIEYGDNQLGVGQADYILSNATVKANSFVLSQGDDGRTATFTMNGSSSVTVTGNVNEDTNKSSIMFGHWKGPSTFTMNGTSTFTASNAQVLVGKTGYNQTINVNGGMFTAKGIKLAGNASGTNKLNLNGGTLALGEVGITSYSTSRTMAIAVGGDATIEATAATLPISQAMTIADGKTLTIKKATGNTNENVALTLSGAISGTGTVKIEEGITTVDFGTTRTTTPFEVSANTVFKATPTAGDEILTFTLKGFTDKTKFELYDTNNQKISDAQVKIEGDLVSVTATPMFTVSTAEANLSTTANWSGSSFVKTGVIIINNTSGAETTITVPEACTYTMVYVRGKVRFKFSENATLSTTGCSIQFHDANAALAIDGGTTEAEYKNTITGAGKVDVYGTVKMTKVSSFTGGITVKPGASLSTSCATCGFGAQSGTMTIEGGATVDFSNAGTLAGLVLKPTNTSTIGLTNITSLTRSSVVLDLSTLDRTNMTYGSTCCRVTGTAGTITSSLMTQVSGDDWYSLSYNGEQSELIVSKLADPKKKFMHYDFNQESLSATNVASDSTYKISSYDGEAVTPTVIKRGKTGTSAKIFFMSDKNYEPYFTSITANKQFLYSGALSVTTVARVMCAPASGNSVLLWNLGSVNNGKNSLGLVAVNETTVALAQTGNDATYRKVICKVEGISNLKTEYHFFAVVIDGTKATLYVDKMTPVEGTTDVTDLGQIGQIGAIHGGVSQTSGYDRVGSTGYYLDDWAIYDLALTADEVNALRKKYCPTPFMITAE